MRQNLLVATQGQAFLARLTLCNRFIVKRTSNRQWWLLHGVLAMDNFVHHLDPVASAACPFCKDEVEETLFHAFLNCLEMQLVFAALSTLLFTLDLDFSENIDL
ncbi:hypothetical protein Y1Q_0019604 [Alligator mississippiensis]|uniref:Reverse transcriptase zinc-binding domain-containing protein n=1 Tax=Alligator mississippiensis TaxID=8496 RepID=A0A151PEE5_ALLMI|nr:hypothetical protein Y1Q_0019604 [Alligator mississippiensis]